MTLKENHHAKLQNQTAGRKTGIRMGSRGGDP